MALTRRCPECGARVGRGDVEMHDAWHEAWRESVQALLTGWRLVEGD